MANKNELLGQATALMSASRIDIHKKDAVVALLTDYAQEGVNGWEIAGTMLNIANALLIRLGTTEKREELEILRELILALREKE